MSVRDEAALWLIARKGNGAGGATAAGGNVLLKTPTHKLDGPEHLTADDTTTLDATTTQHGLLPKLSGDVLDALRGDGSWAALDTAGIDLAGDSGSASGIDDVTVEGAGGIAVMITDDGGGAATVTIDGSAVGSGTDLGWFNVMDYGATGDGSTDDTTAIQDTIDAAVAVGGGTVYFPIGVYIVGGALQDTGAFNGQLLLPDQSTSSTQIFLRFLGAGRPPFAFHGTAPNPGAFSIIKSTLTGASGTAAVFSGGNGSFPTSKNVQVVVENLMCLGPDDPTFTFWNLSCNQGGAIRDLQISTTGAVAGSVVQPTHTNAYAIKLPQARNSNYTYVDGLSVGGFYTGILQGELAICRGLIVGISIVGIEFGGPGEHASLIVDVQVTSSAYPFKATSIHYCDILSYDFETGTGPSWGDTVYDLDDASNYLHGAVRYWGYPNPPTHSFTKNGGSNFTATVIGDLPSPAGSAGGDLSGTYPNPTVPHITDATDAHDASAISIADAGGYYTGTDVEAALQEIGAGGIGASGQYRAWLFTASGGTLTILTAVDGTPLTGLMDLE